MTAISPSPAELLRKSLEDALVQANNLEMPLVAIKIAEALDDLRPRQGGESRQIG